MTRSQRRAHRAVWVALAVVLVGLAGWALRTRELARTPTAGAEGAR